MYNYKHKIIAIFLLLGGFGISTIAFGDALRDPTRPLTHKGTFVKAAKGDNIKISAIFAGKDSSVVVIGKHAFVVGDKIVDATIIAIDKDGIVLKNEDGSEYRVKMSYPTIKSPSKNRKEYREN